MSINLKPDEVKLHTSFASIFNLTDDTAGFIVELRAWRDALLQPTQTAGAIFNMQKPRGQVSYGASDLAGRPQRFDGVSARGLPARHYACPTHADLPQPLPGRLWSRRSSIKSDLGVHDRPR